MKFFSNLSQKIIIEVIMEDKENENRLFFVTSRLAPSLQRDLIPSMFP